MVNRTFGMFLGFPSGPAEAQTQAVDKNGGAAVKLRSRAFFFVYHIEQTFAGQHFLAGWHCFAISTRTSRCSPEAPRGR